MIDRNLRLIESNNGNYAEFIKYIQGRPKVTKRLLSEKEVIRAKELIATNNPYDIDNFCYSIS